jgi:hypothetical protein
VATPTAAIERSQAPGATLTRMGTAASPPGATPSQTYVTKSGKVETAAQHAAHVAWGKKYGAIMHGIKLAHEQRGG